MTWVQALLLALARMRVQSRRKYHLHPSKILYGQPYQIPGLPGDMHVKGESDVIKYLVTLGKIILEINKRVVVNRSLNLDSPAHPFQPRNWVYVKSWNSEPLMEKWKGPFQVPLIMYAAVQVEGKGPWIHYS